MLTHLRIGQIALGLFGVLADEPEGVSRADLLAARWEGVRPMSLSARCRSDSWAAGRQALSRRVGFGKENRRWYLTEEARAAYDRYQGPIRPR